MGWRTTKEIEMHYYEITTAAGKRYGIQAVEMDDARSEYRPHVSELDANGEPVRTIVDSEQTDEVFTDPRACLQTAIMYVI
jgi:hypothetical protein